MADTNDNLPGCRRRLRLECCSCSGWFTIHEGGNQILDIQETFCNRHVVTLVGKTITTVWTASVMVQGILDFSPYYYFYFAYLTHWVKLLSVVYLIMSWCNSFLPSQPKQPENGNGDIASKSSPSTHSDAEVSSLGFEHDNNADAHEIDAKHNNYTTATPSIWICLTWVMATIALHGSSLVTVLYWTLVFDDHITYIGIMAHGGILVLVFVDVLLLNRIPIRWKFLFFSLLWTVLYAIWTIIHAVADIGNPFFPNGGDVLYDVIDWKENFYGTMTVVVMAFLVLSPIVYSILWIVSLYSFPCTFKGANRRYIIQKSEKEKNKDYPFMDDF